MADDDHAGDGHARGLTLHSAKGRVALLATVAASGMAMLDATVVNVALPRIGDELDSGLSGLQWVLTGYLLALSSLILLGGALGDRLGRRRVFMAGTVWFAAASVLCGAAPSVAALIAGRVLQGAGAALLTPGSLAILQVSFTERDRGAAVGAWSGLSGVAGAIGPFVGGSIVDGPGWRWAFLLNVPVAVLVVICARAAVPETRDPQAVRAVDMIGAALAATSMATATWALTEAGHLGWTNPAVVASGAIAVVAATAFVRRMRRTADPLVPPALFRSREFTVTNLATALLYAALGVSFLVVAYELQVAANWTALRAGSALLPATLLMFALSAASGSLAQSIGPRLQLTVGPLLTATGLLLLTRIGPGASWLTDVLPGATLYGLGLVTFVAPLTAAVMAAVGADHASIASGVNNAVARTASLAALALVPVVSGLSSANGALEITSAFRTSLVVAASLAAAAGVVCFAGLRAGTSGQRTARRVHCAVDGPPLQPQALR